MRQLTAALLSVLCVAFSATAQSKPDRLTEFLQSYVGISNEETKTTQYFSAFVDLRDDGTKEVIVYLSSDGWCGTGGCTMLLLAPEDSSYRVITRTTITRPPIRVLTTKTNGWHDLGVWVQGGGIQPGYEAKLSFNGKKYPGNPSAPPAQRLTRKVAGKIVVPTTVFGNQPERKPKVIGVELIIPGESIGGVHLGMKESDLQGPVFSWRPKADLTIPHKSDNSCHDTEVDWFDDENGSPGVSAYVADDRVYEIKTNWDERFKMQGIGTIFGRSFTDLKAVIIGGELLRLPDSAWMVPSGTDELFWVDTNMGIAFRLDWNVEDRSRTGKRTVQSVTVFRPQTKFQPDGCADRPLVSVK
jgi:hypothetical protein